MPSASGGRRHLADEEALIIAVLVVPLCGVRVVRMRQTNTVLSELVVWLLARPVDEIDVRSVRPPELALVFDVVEADPGVCVVVRLHEEGVLEQGMDGGKLGAGADGGARVGRLLPGDRVGGAPVAEALELLPRDVGRTAGGGQAGAQQDSQQARRHRGGQRGV